MTAARQIVLSIVVLLIAGAGWLACDRGWFTSAPATTAVATAPPGAGGQGAGQGGQNGPGAPRTGQGGGGQGGRGGGGGGFGGPAPILAAPVTIDSAGLDITAVGTVAASKAIDVYPQVTGMVTAISFQPGLPVTAGQKLVSLDSADQEVAVQKAQVAVDTAQAAYDRMQLLAKSNNASTVDVSTAHAALESANIDLKAAQLDLAKRTISAPFAGTIGLTDISVGDLISSAKPITTLDDMSIVTVSFQVPERASGLVAVGQDVAGTTDALAGQSFTGKVTAVDSRVDATTRTLGVEASLPNSASALKPGMALTLTMKFPGAPNPAVSSLSIQWDRQGSYVWKVDGDVVHRVSVQIVTRRSGVVTVGAKLKAGDLVVTDGVLRLREGTAVAMTGPPVGASAEVTGQPAGIAPPGGEASKTGRQKPPPTDQPKT